MMTVAYLLARKEPIEDIQIGVEYRCVGNVFVNGAKYIVSKIESEFIYLKGYVKPVERKKVLFFLVD
jgi:hypothetical protein